MSAGRHTNIRSIIRVWVAILNLAIYNLRGKDHTELLLSNSLLSAVSGIFLNYSEQYFLMRIVPISSKSRRFCSYLSPVLFKMRRR